RYLLLRIQDAGGGQGNAADVALPATQGILAAMLNVSRSKLNAQLQAWQRSGLASYQRGRLPVHDLDRLRARACASGRDAPAGRLATRSHGAGVAAAPRARHQPPQASPSTRISAAYAGIAGISPAAAA